MSADRSRRRSDRGRRAVASALAGQLIEPLENRTLLSASLPQAALNAIPDHAGPARFIVTLADGVDANAFAAEMKGRGAEVSQIYSHALNGIAFRGHAPIKDPRVVRVEADFIMTTFVQTIPTGVQRIGTESNAVAKIDGNDERVDVGIAIIDSGIDRSHPDLNVVGGFNALPGGAGKWDDGYGHGTHVAGIAAALDNDIGVVGVAPGARLWAVRVLGNNGSGWVSDIIKGIDWVTANSDKIQVANMSLGGTGYSLAYQQAIQKSVAAGVVYIAAAGNSSMDIYGSDGVFGGSDVVPAAYPEVATISAMVDLDGKRGGVGGTTSWGPDDTFASFSNYSASVVTGNPVESTGKAIDLVMPGVSILSTARGGGYAFMSGTSMAAPHAAGLAALYIAANKLQPTIAADVYAIRQALIDNAWKPGSDGYLVSPYGDRDANNEPLGKAADVVVPPPTSYASPVNLSASNVKSDSAMINWEYSGTGIKEFKIVWSAGSNSWSATVSANDRSYTATGLSANTTYTFRVVAVYSDKGEGISDPLTVTTANTTPGKSPKK